MAHVSFLPPYTDPALLTQQLRQQGFALLAPAGVAQWLGCDAAQLQALEADWQGLPPDEFLKGGGRYRNRRHACFVVQGAAVEQVAHRAHWQPLEYNALHGGMQRWFAPMLEATVARPVWQQMLRALADLTQAVGSAPAQPWFIEAHQFRITTEGGLGRPTPEGAHRDGVDVVAVFLLGREHITGGETRIFEADGPAGQRFTLTEPWSLLLLDDARMIHETTPIRPEGGAGWRDTLVLTCRSGGFQGDAFEVAPDRRN